MVIRSGQFLHFLTLGRLGWGTWLKGPNFNPPQTDGPWEEFHPLCKCTLLLQLYVQNVSHSDYTVHTHPFWERWGGKDRTFSIPQMLCLYLQLPADTAWKSHLHNLCLFGHGFCCGYSHINICIYTMIQEHVQIQMWMQIRIWIQIYIQIQKNQCWSVLATNSHPINQSTVSLRYSGSLSSLTAC